VRTGTLLAVDFRRSLLPSRGFSRTARRRIRTHLSGLIRIHFGQRESSICPQIRTKESLAVNV
jgi:hypothetical protein